jgi:hypothetical protein
VNLINPTKTTEESLRATGPVAKLRNREIEAKPPKGKKKVPGNWTRPHFPEQDQEQRMREKLAETCATPGAAGSTGLAGATSDVSVGSLLSPPSPFFTDKQDPMGAAS